MYTEFPCLKIFPLHRHSFWDCLRILAHAFDLGFVLLMGIPPLVSPAASLCLSSKDDILLLPRWWHSPLAEPTETRQRIQLGLRYQEEQEQQPCYSVVISSPPRLLDSERKGVFSCLEKEKETGFR